MKTNFIHVIALIAVLITPRATLSQGWNVELVGSYYDLWSNAESIAVSSNYAYVTTSSTGLRVVDISDQTNPVEVGYCNIPGDALSVAVSVNQAYVTCQQGEVLIYDVSDPTNPNIVSQLALPGVAHKGVISGDYLYVANDTSGLQIIDVSNPYSPAVISSLPTSSYVKDIDIEGDYAYLAASFTGLRVIDISDPYNPIEIAADSSDFHPSKIVVEGYYAYMVDYLQLLIFDISDPANPTEIATCYICDDIRAIDVSGSNVYIAVAYQSSSYSIGGAGLIFVDASDPNNPYFNIAPVYRRQSIISDITIGGNTAYIVSGSDGLRLLDISSPADPQELGCYDTPGNCRSIVTAGNYAYTEHYSAGLRVIDIADPSNPFETTSLQLDHSLWKLILQDHVIFSTLSISWDSCGFVAIDISDPDHPAEIGRYIRQSYAPNFRFDIAGDYAYLTLDSLHVLNIAEIGNIHQVSSAPLEHSAHGVVISGDYLYTRYGGYYSGTAFVRIYDLSDPFQPYEIGSWNAQASQLSSLAVSDNYVFLTAKFEDIPNFIVLDVSKHSNPQEIGRCEIPYVASKIVISGVHAILAAWGSGIRIMDISDPMDPIEIGYYYTPGSARDVSVRDTLAFVADQYFFEILDISQAIGNPQNPKIPVSFSLHPAYPNPFNSSTVLPYSISNEGKITLKIYNVLGQKVAALFDGIQQPGHHSVIWDATIVSSGIYFAQLNATNHTKTIKMLLLK